MVRGSCVAAIIVLGVLGAAYALQPEGEGSSRRPYVTRPAEKVREFRTEDPSPDSRKKLLERYSDWAGGSGVEIVDRDVVETGGSLAIYAFYLERG